LLRASMTGRGALSLAVNVESRGLSAIVQPGRERDDD
jgi:hypothetical protein